MLSSKKFGSFLKYVYSSIFQILGLYLQRVKGSTTVLADGKMELMKLCSNYWQNPQITAVIMTCYHCKMHDQ